MIEGRETGSTLSAVIRIRNSPGSVWFEAPPLFARPGEEFIDLLVAKLLALDAVCSVDVDRNGQSVEIHYDCRTLVAKAALRQFADALTASDSVLLTLPCREVLSSRAVRYKRHRISAGELPTNSVLPGRGRRLVNLALGAGSFLMSIVGIMTPFVPTMPFVLATGYFLAGSSPLLHAMFTKSPLFGEMLRDWKELGGWRLRTKLKLLVLMAGVWGITLAIVEVSAPLIVTMGAVSSISVIAILRVRTVSDAASPAAGLPATVIT